VESRDGASSTVSELLIRRVGGTCPTGTTSLSLVATPAFSSTAAPHSLPVSLLVSLPAARLSSWHRSNLQSPCPLRHQTQGSVFVAIRAVDSQGDQREACGAAGYEKVRWRGESARRAPFQKKTLIESSGGNLPDRHHFLIAHRYPCYFVNRCPALIASLLVILLASCAALVVAISSLLVHHDIRRK
jgi:hypothetical protein